VKLEKMGKPGVFINCDTFEGDAKSASQDNAMPAVRRVRISSAEFYKVRGSAATIKPLVEKVLPEIIDTLTRPLAPEEIKPKAEKKVVEEPAVIKITSASMLDALEDFNQQYLDKQWGDGLPMIPPTPEKVKWMLSGTTRSPQEALGIVHPKKGICTIEKIAINAVMAGAKPEYLPVIIAAMEALTDKDFDNLHVLASAGSFTMMICVSGPIGKEIGMNSGIGFLGHGWRSNNTIGRAVRLSTLNIGQTWPGKNDMALTGRVSPHTFYCFAENTDASPWQPYHAGRGFKADASCVTVGSMFGHSSISNFFGGMIGTWTAPAVLDNIVAYVIRSERRQFPEWSSKGMGPFPGSGTGSHKHMIVLFPELAAEYKKMGFDQAGLQDEIYKRATVKYEELSPADIKGIQGGIELDVVPADRKAVFEQALKPGGNVPVLISPECLHLFISGGAPGCAFSFAYYRIPPYNRTALLTKQVTWATLTKAGR
jgi:hypothetical protein